MLYTGHIVNPVLEDIRSLYESGPSLANVRCESRQSTAGIFSMVQRGEIDFGFSSAAQVDQYGNVNTTVIGDYRQPTLRMLGSVLLPEHFTLFGREYILMEHSRRRFVPRVDFISAPGFIDGPGAREKAGLRRGGGGTSGSGGRSLGGGGRGSFACPDSSENMNVNVFANIITCFFSSFTLPWTGLPSRSVPLWLLKSSR
jgi:hypothetical protein